MNTCNDNIITGSDDGSDTIFVPSLNEHYHSTRGAIQEAMHVYVNPWLNSAKAESVNILEVGFGTGLNALLTLLETGRKGISVHYSSVEKYPLDTEIAMQLNYPELTGNNSNAIFRMIHECNWDKTVPINKLFSLLKLNTDIKNFIPGSIYDVIYFDAFGPSKQPSVWSDKVISAIASSCVKGGIFLTYSSTGRLKRQLASIGYDVKHLPGPPGKREITMAIRT